MLNSQLSLVPTEVYHVSHPHQSTYHTDLTGLVKPRYVSTVSDSPSFFPLPIVKGLKRVAKALEFLHQWQIHEDVEGLAATFLLMSVVLGFWETLSPQDLSTVVLFLAPKVFTL